MSSTQPPVYARLTALVADALTAAFPDLPTAPDPGAPEVQVIRSKAGFDSDYQCAVAMQLARPLRSSPRKIAEAIAERLRAAADPLLASVDVGGPGFLGLVLADAGLSALVAAHGDRFGTPSHEGTVVIDYSSPNVAKQMHVGHLRSTIIGDALRRIGTFLGYRVIADNHIGDWGTQFGQLIYAWNHWRDEAAYAADPVAELERLYVKFAQDADDHMKEAARAELARLQAGDPTNHALWARFRADSQHVFDTVYERLGVHFDVTYGESHYHDRLAPLVDELVARGLARESEGALCVFFPGEGEDAEDALPPYLIRKKDGAFLYATTDLATVRFREETWRPDRVIYVTDLRQRLHFQQLFACARTLGVTTRLDHVWFGLMKLPEGAISTRKGNVIALKDLLDEGQRRARESATGRERDVPLTEAELDALGEMVGLGAIKYADLSNNPQTDVVFDFDTMLALNGDTAVYLQYTSARTHSVARKTAAQGVPPADGVTIALDSEHERDLLLHLLEFGTWVRAAWESGRPSDLAHYLYKLADKYHRFYQACPILKSEGALQRSRQNLNLLTQRTLVQGLDLLGIGAPERM